MIAPAGLRNGDKGLHLIGGGHQAPTRRESDANAMSLVPVPGQQEKAGVPRGKGSQKKFFSSSTDEISEASLAEGFSFPSMQALQQGQLSNPLASDFSPPEPKSPQISPINRVSSNKQPGSILSPYFKRTGLLDSFPPCPSGPVANGEPTGGKQQTSQLQPLGPDSGHPAQSLTPKAKEQGSNAALRLKIQNLKNLSRHLGQDGGSPKEPSVVDKPSSASAKALPPNRTGQPSPKTVLSVSHGMPSKENIVPSVLEAAKSVADPPRTREKLRTPDVAPMQTRRCTPMDLVGSPPFCGDLDFPARPSPAVSRRYSRHRWDNRPVGSCTPRDRDRRSRHGSLPRVSAISKKRSSDHKHPSRSDLDRKKAAMYQVAQYWNECIRIAEEEKVQANVEIDKLQDELCRQDQELQEFRASLDRKNKKLHDMEGLTRTLQEEKGLMAEEKTALSRQVETLRDELAESRDQSQSLGDKFQICQEELHQATREQKALSIRFNSSQETIDQLRKEKDTSAADSDAFVKAIDDSRKKREELKQCVEELRAEAQRELLQKDQTISELSSKLGECETKLADERLASDRFRAQFENEASSIQIVRQLETKMDSLLAMNTTSDNERQKEQHENALIINGVQDKLDSVLTAFEMASSRALTSSHLEQKLKDLSEEIMTRVLPAISLLSPDQAIIEAAISSLQQSVTSGLETIQEGLKQQEEESRMHWEGNQNQASESIGLLQGCKDDLDVSRAICQGLESRIDSWIDHERQACQDAAAVRLDDAQDRLRERGERIKSLEDQLQLARDDHAAKLEALDKALLNQGEEAKSCVQDAAMELRGLLEEEIKTVKSMTEKMDREREDFSASLIARIENAKEKSSSLETVSLSAEATSMPDGTVVASLKLKIKELEAAAKKNEKLREQWRQDLKALEVIRKKQKVLMEKLPLVQGFDAKIDRVMELNTSIQSTSQYLATETEWIGKQLEAKLASLNSEVSRDPESSAIPAIPASDVPMVQDEDSDPEANDTSTKREVAIRRVTVHSPVLRASSPSSPDAPSVKQEQRRRREATQVRPILKQHAPYARELNDHSVDFSHLLAQNTKANGQAMMSPAARSRLARHCGYFFPTMADFESNSQVSNVEGQTAGSKHGLSPGDADFDRQGVKKFKRT